MTIRVDHGQPQGKSYPRALTKGNRAGPPDPKFNIAEGIPSYAFGRAALFSYYNFHVAFVFQ